MRMLETGGDLDLAQEPVGPERDREFGAQHFHGDVAIDPHIAGPVDDRHAAAPDFAFESVTPVERRSEAADLVRSRAHVTLQGWQESTIWVRNPRRQLFEHPPVLGRMRTALSWSLTDALDRRLPSNVTPCWNCSDGSKSAACSGRSSRRWPAPLPASPRSLDDDRLAQPGPRPDCRSAHQNHTGVYGAERRHERRHGAPPGDPSADTGLGRLHARAGAHPRTAREVRHAAQTATRVPPPGVDISVSPENGLTDAASFASYSLCLPPRAVGQRSRCPTR